MGELKAAILAAIQPGETVSRAQMIARLPQYPAAIVGSSLAHYLRRVGTAKAWFTR